jgi:transcriptional/translational regulatory protein YebC/TACO1
VIERAIKKAQGGELEAYTPGRYEAFGPGNSLIVIETLTDNVNRSVSEVRGALSKRGGKMGSVLFNFTEYGQFIFHGTEVAKLEEALILGDVDLQSIRHDQGQMEVLVTPGSFNQAKKVIEQQGIQTFLTAEITLIPNETMTLEGENLMIFKQLIDVLDGLQDVQNVYHNVEL